MQPAFSAFARMAVYLFDLADGRRIAVLSDEQFQFLADHLESEGEDDDDYYVNQATVQALQEQGGDPQVINALQAGLAGRTEMDIRWQRDAPASDDAQ
jgi:hypothetical protein